MKNVCPFLKLSRSTSRTLLMEYWFAILICSRKELMQDKMGVGSNGQQYASIYMKEDACIIIINKTIAIGKVPITTAADDKLYDIFLNFRKNKV